MAGASQITYGTPLSAAQLNATANVPGTFAYTPSNGTVVNAGAANLSVIFTPTDAVDYSSVTGSVSLVVLPAALTVTATGPSKTYGTALTPGSSTVNFIATGMQNNETVTSVTLTPDAAGASPATPAGALYTVAPSAATGTINPNNYTITYTAFTGTVGTAPLTVTATGPSKTYGTALTSGTSSASFTATGMQNNETVTSVTLTPDAAGASPTTPAQAAYTVAPSAATGTINPNNYTITYTAFKGTVGTAALTVTATGPSGKPYGTPLTAGTSAVNFTATGMQNNETVTSVTLTPDAAGLSTTAPAGALYTVAPSAAAGTINTNNYTITYTAFKGTVGTATLVVTATGPANKTYGRPLTAGTSTAYFMATAAQNGETVTSVTLTPDAAGASPATPAGAAYKVTPSAATGTISANNYNIAYNPYTGAVSPTPLTVTAANASKTYGGVLSFGSGSAAFTTTGLQNSETIGSVTLACTGGAGTAAVGGYTINPSAATGGTFNPANYTITYQNGGLSVNPAALTITANNRSKTYGQVAVFAGTELTPSGLQNSETVGSATLSSSGAAATASVAGSPYAIVPSAVTGGTFNPANYTITYQNGGLSVNPAALTITANNRSKTYGQVAVFAGTELTPSGLQNSETVGSVTLSSSGAAATASVAGSPYAIVPRAATGGTFNPANYTITYQNGALSVNPAALTITANNRSKTYGQVAVFAGTELTPSGLQNSETVGSVTLSSSGAAATASVAGSPYAIVPSAATGGTFSPANYTITYQNGTLSVNPAALTITANNRSKTYGQVVVFAGTELTPSGLQNSETVGSVTLSSSGAAATASVAGSPYAIVPSAATGGTFSPANYTITYQNGTLSVNPAALTITANNRSKTYGQVVVFAGTEFTASGLQNSETVGSVTLSSSGAAATASVAGSPYAIVPSAPTGGTFNPANYVITYADGTLTVTPALLAVTATGPTKTYGTALTAGTSTASFTATGMQNGETVTSVTLTPNAAGLSATAAAGVAYTVTPSLATGTITPSNYAITYNAYSGTVSQAPLTVTATGPSKTYGAALTAGTSTVSFTATGMQNGETVTSVTLTPNAAGASPTTPAGSTYTVTPSLATGTINANNYTITYNPYTGTVAAAPLTVTATGPSKTYGTALTAGTSTVNFTATGMQNGETVTSVTLTPSGAGASATAAVGSAYTVTPSLATGTINANNYTITYNPYTGTVAPAPLTVTATGPAKTYGTALTAGASTVNFTATGMQNGETVTSVTLTPTGAGASATAAAGSAYTVTPSLATGTISANNYNITYNSFSGTVSQAPLTVTATGPSKAYGTALTAGTSTVNFTATGMQNGETVTSVTLTPNAAGLSAATAAGLGYTVTPSAAAGTIAPSNYAITYNAYSGTVGTAALGITANNDTKTYGQTKTYGPGSTNFTSVGLQNGESVGSVTITASGGTNASDAVRTYQLIPSAATGGTFATNNYAITYTNGTLTINPAPRPTIASIVPDTGLTNGGTVVSILGTGFESGATVNFGSIAATAVTFVNPTNLSATSPPAAAGAVNIVVTNADGQTAVFTNGFTYVTTNVPPQPAFLGVTTTAGEIHFTWSAIAGQNYQLQYKTNLSQVAWSNLGGVITATDSTAAASGSIGPDRQRFYRVMAQ